MNELVTQNKILFLCTGNSCRSQMAEGLAKKYLPNYEIKSAGTNPEPINPYAIIVMNEIKINISNVLSKSVLKKDINSYDYIITLCGEAKDKCINFNDHTKQHIHWDINDPANTIGTNEQKLKIFRKIRNQIEKKIMLLKKELMNKKNQ